MKINCTAKVKIDWGHYENDEFESEEEKAKFLSLPKETKVEIEYHDNGDWEDTEADMYQAAYDAVEKKFDWAPNEIVDVLAY